MCVRVWGGGGGGVCVCVRGGGRKIGNQMHTRAHTLTHTHLQLAGIDNERHLGQHRRQGASGFAQKPHTLGFSLTWLCFQY